MLLKYTPIVSSNSCSSIGEYTRSLLSSMTFELTVTSGCSLSEIAYALAEDKPVIGLNTWELMRNNSFDNKIIRAKNANDAVEKALEQILDK